MTRNQGLKPFVTPKFFTAIKRASRLNKTRGFTLIELMIVVMTIAVLASTAMAAFSNYQLRAKASEAPVGLAKMVQGETEYGQRYGNFLDAGPTNIPPAEVKVAVNFPASDPRWKTLAFEFADSIYFGYQASVSGSSVNCEAMGDLNGNGVTSIYRRTVTSSGNQVIATGLYIFDELE